jgi:hypothetical protein
MAKKKAKTKYGAPLRVDDDVVRMARMIDAVRGGGIQRIISDAARPVLTRIVKEMAAAGEFAPPTREGQG